MSQIDSAVALIQSVDINIPIQLTTVIGLDLINANNPNYQFLKGADLTEYIVNKPTHQDQHRLDRSVLYINKEIVLRNAANRIPTAWGANVVHAYKRGKIYHRYNRLVDGCHYSEGLNEEWCKILCSSFAKMSKVPFNY